jgi:ankyrin repeat protein
MAVCIQVDDCDKGITALQMILASKNLQLLDRLLYYKPDVNATDEFNNSILHYACAEGNKDLAERLVKDLVADISIENSSGYLPLHAAIISDSLDCFLLMLRLMAHLSSEVNILQKPISKEKKFTCLHLAIAYNSVHIFQHCLEAFPQPPPLNVNSVSSLSSLDAQDSEGKTPLILAIEMENLDFAKQLIKRNASLFIMDFKGCNVLFYLLAKSSNVQFFHLFEVGF